MWIIGPWEPNDSQTYLKEKFHEEKKDDYDYLKALGNITGSLF